MTGTGIHTSRAAAAIHVAMFLLIVVGTTGVLFYLTGVSRLKAEALDVTAPIPELARWHNP